MKEKERQRLAHHQANRKSQINPIVTGLQTVEAAEPAEEAKSAVAAIQTDD